jgi:hypothetical protein
MAKMAGLKQKAQSFLYSIICFSVSRKDQSNNLHLQPYNQRHTQTKSVKTKLKKIYQACRNQKQAGIALFISDKADFKQKSVRRDKELPYILIHGTVQQEA